MDTHQHTTDQPFVLPADAGEHFHFLNHLATVKVSGKGRALSVVEFRAERGFGPPLHSHDHEDEFFVVLEGEVRFAWGDIESIATAGGSAFLPHGLAHTFQIVSPQARFITVTGATTGSPRFDAMVAELGEPSEQPVLPDPGPIDPGLVAEVCRAHGIEILGPPPEALT